MNMVVDKKKGGNTKGYKNNASWYYTFENSQKNRKYKKGERP